MTSDDTETAGAADVGQPLEPATAVSGPSNSLFGEPTPVGAAELLKVVEERLRATRTQSFDISVGEILSIHERGELVIRPEFQRLFRWSVEKQSRFIESLLLEIPVPPIFVIETDSGVFELIDGLQRITSVMNFFNEKAPLVLEGCDIVREFNGHTAQSLPLALRLRAKRVPLRMVVVKRESSPHAKYEMFYRLNTGGEPASDQEVRNCVIRIIDNAFNQFIIDCASFTAYRTCISNFPLEQIKKLYDQELVLRFFAFKNAKAQYRHAIGEFMTDYMLGVTEKRLAFEYSSERAVFEQAFTALAAIDGEYVFCRVGEAGVPTKRATPNFFEAFSLGIVPHLDRIDIADAALLAKLRVLFRKIRQDPKFLDHTGAGSNQPSKLIARIDHVSTELAGSL